MDTLLLGGALSIAGEGFCFVAFQFAFPTLTPKLRPAAAQL